MEELFKLLKGATDITDNSKEVKEGSIFFAVRGTKFDGHTFIGEVLKRKPLAVVVEKDYTPPKGLNFGNTKLIKVENSQRAFALSCKEFFGRPDEKLAVIGVTGTNGKTSTTYIIAGILEKLKAPCGVIGTVSYRLGSKIFGKGTTTPHPKVWYSTLKEMANSGAKFVASEVSSHALEQFRIYGTTFGGVIFTNLTKDHLDYHQTMENYFKAKERLFKDYRYRVGVANIDDPYGRKLAKKYNLKGFGLSKDAHYRILEPKVSDRGCSFKLQTPNGRVWNIETNLLGEFQIFNLTGAIATLNLLGFPMEALQRAVKNLPQIPGRFEVVVEKPFKVVVDYAHTPDALEKLLKSVRKILPPKGRVITVFGAGGNRDKTKRPLMGAVAEKYSDLVVITSDNPRFEEPTEIINHILEGIKDRSKVFVEPDRKRAIEIALNLAREGNFVVVAGKGHEDYQEIRGKRIPFDDREVVRMLISPKAL